MLAEDPTVAKQLVFRLGEQQYAFTLTKVDRAKLYGYKEVEVLDEQDRPCELATLADDGHTIVGRGGTAIGYLTASGEWAPKTSLTPVDLEGNEIRPVPSSFVAPIELADVAAIDDYLSHDIRLVYALETEDDTTLLDEQLAAGAIYRFPYSYRGGLEADAGFLLCGEDGHTYLAVGNSTTVEFLTLQQIVISDEDEALDEETTLMDFGML